MKINAFAIFFLSESRGLARLGALDPSLRLFWRVFFCRCACLFLCTGDLAVAETTHRFDVPAGRAVETLKLAARQGCVEIAFFAETVRGVQTPELHGDFATRDALARLVADTGLIVVSDRRDHTFIVRRAPSSPPHLFPRLIPLP